MGEVNKETEKVLLSQACPMSASVHWDPKEDTSEDTQAWLAVYNKLPYQVRLGLVDEKTEERILKIAKKYNIYKVGEIGEISRIIRDSFVEEGFDEDNIKARILERLKIDESKVDVIFKELFFLRNKITSLEEGGLDVKLERIDILSAINEYPDVNKQTIGKRKIVIFGTTEYVKPTIKNWLDDFTLQKGAQSHNNLERSDYIFNSKNVQKLTFDEKRNLLSVLESYDERKELNLDISKNIFLFNDVKKIEKQKAKKTVKKLSKKSQKKEKKSILGDFPFTGIETVELERAKIKEDKKDTDIRENKSKHIVNLKEI